jgi:hypothetical protein
MLYVVKYAIKFIAYDKEVVTQLEVENGLAFFDSERNRNVYSEKDAVDYVKALHSQGKIDKLYTLPEEVYSIEGDVGETSLKILRTWIG